MHLGVDVFISDGYVTVPDVARAVEEAGLESLFLAQYTHLTVRQRRNLEKLADAAGPVPVTDRASMVDPFVALGAAAAVTCRITLGTGACFPAIYDPLILAKQVSTIDQLSHGRFALGITAGWDELLIRNHGVEPAQRWDVMREKTLALRHIWTEPEVEFRGRYVNFGPIEGIKTVQSPHPPILVGSHGPRGLSHAVEYGDAWFPVLSPGLNLERNLSELARRCEDAGRDPLPVTVYMSDLDEDALIRCHKAGVHRCLVGLFPQREDKMLAFLHDYSRIGSRLN
jgi:probable F420-dependent oxidoreductase